MRAKRAGIGGRSLVLTAAVLLGGWGAWALGADAPPRMTKADEPPGSAPAKTDTPPPKPDAPAKAPVAPRLPQKKVAFQFADVPWQKVFEWLAEQTGMPVITTDVKPTGTLTFIPPKEGSGLKQYTIPEIIDALNDELEKQNMILVRKAKTFTLATADKPVNPGWLPRIREEDLGDYGTTEMVSVVIDAKPLIAEDVSQEIKNMLGPFGNVSVIATANQLILQDKALNILRVVETIHKIRENETGQTENYTYKCVYIPCREAERILKDQLGNVEQQQRLQQPPQGGFRGDFGGGFGGDFRGGFGGDFRGGMGGDPRSSRSSQQQQPKFRMHYVTSDEANNQVLVAGPPDKIAQAKIILKQIDVKDRDGEPVLTGKPFFETYQVTPGTAADLVKALTQVYVPSANLRISAVGANAILVYASPNDHYQIKQQILRGEAKGAVPKTESIPVDSVDAQALVDKLKAIYGDPRAASTDPKASVSAPYIDLDPSGAALIVRGTQDQLEDVKTTLSVIAKGSAAVGGGTRVITLDKGSAATLAEALQRLLPQMRKNPVQVILPGTEGSPKPDEPKPDEPRKEKPGSGPPMDKAKDPTDKRSAAPPQLPPGTLVAHQLVDPRDLPDKDNRPGDKDKPITITAFGNKLMVTCDDPKVMADINKLVQLLTQTKGTEGDFQVIRLKHADATEAAKVLDETFNGKRQQNQQQQRGNQGRGQGGFVGGGGPGGFFNPFAAPGAQVPTNPQEDRITVVADRGTNSILVRASPLDMLTIRRLLDRALDTGETDSDAVQQTWVIGPLKFATASEVANVLRDVYREQTNQNPQASSVNGFRGVAFGAFGGNQQAINRNIGPDGNPRAVSLSIALDDRSNSLILQCSRAMYEDVKRLTERLEEDAKSSQRTVRVVQLKGIDPTIVQQAIDAFQGRTTTRPSTSNGTPGTGGFGGGQGGNFGGRQGGFGGGQGGFGGGQGGGFPQGGGIMPFGGGGFGGGRGGGGAGGARPGGLGAGQGRGPGFFEQRVMDDPEPSLLYDPRLDAPAAAEEAPPAGNAQSKTNAPAGGVRPAHFEEEQQPEPLPPGPPPPAGTPIVGPRSPVTAEALPELGAIVISGNNPDDVEAVLRIIQFIQQVGVAAEIQIELVPLEHADATSVVTTLNQLYSRVNVGTGGNTAAPIPQTTTTQGPFGPVTQGAQRAASIVLIAMPRFNSILMAVPKARVKDVLKEIKRLDQPTAPQGQATPFKLTKASAARVETLLTNFYAQRYPNETAAQHQVRITHDDSTNTVFVQAGPADLEEIRTLINLLDTSESSAINDLRIIPLRNALADEVATLLLRAIAEGIAPATTAGAGILPTAGGGALGGAGGGGALGAAGGGALGAGGGGGFLGATGGATGRLGATGGAAGFAGGSTTVTKTTSLRFISGPPGRERAVESGLLEDVHIISDARTNSLIVAAPEKTMNLIRALVFELDSRPVGIKVYRLRRGDALTIANNLQQLYLGTGGLGGAGRGGLGAGGLGAGGTGLGLGGTGLADQLRITADERTNSIIYAGNEDQLLLIESIISRLDDTEVDVRRSEVYHLRNASAADVATALNNFFTQTTNAYALGAQFGNVQEIQRQVIIVPEPFLNKLLISAPPSLFGDIMRLILELDAESPQVVIQVLVADVDLTNSEEFGVEIGLQSPVLFQRSVIPAFNFTPNTLGPGNLLGTGTVSYANAAGGLVAPGVTVNSSVNPAALPGFNFNSTGALPNNPVVSPGMVGFQGLGNLGVGRASPNNANLGGFVFSAASDAFTLLIRALKTQGRLEVLSRPQVMTLDNQTAAVNVGQLVPYVTSTTLTATGLSQSNVTQQQVGVGLTVTPRISPDGKVLMRVEPQISSLTNSTVSVGTGITLPIINTQDLQTTVVAGDGETVVLGGLIQKRDNKTENKIPWFGDLPGVGSLFRFRTITKERRELLIILTPHIVRSRLEADRILVEESRRMDWMLHDVIKVHGTSGLEPIIPAPAPGTEVCVPPLSAAPPGLPVLSAPPVPPVPGVTTPREQLPPPTPVPPGTPPAPSGAAAAPAPAINTTAPAQSGSVPAGTAPPAPPPAAPPQGSGDGFLPADQGKESDQWQSSRKN